MNKKYLGILFFSAACYLVLISLSLCSFLNGPFLNVLKALDSNLIQTSHFLSFYIETTGANLNDFNHCLNVITKIKRDLLSFIINSSDFEITQKFFSIYHEYINTFADKTSNMQQFVEKLSSWEHLTASSFINSNSLISLVFCIFSIFFIVTAAIGGKNLDKKNTLGTLTPRNNNCRSLTLNGPPPSYEEATNKQNTIQKNVCPPGYTECCNENTAKQQNPNSRIEFSGNCWSKIKAILLIDDDSQERIRNSNKSWFQHISRSWFQHISSFNNINGTNKI